MERDGLRSNLQRTAEESKRLVQEGDEQVERITKESERITRLEGYVKQPSSCTLHFVLPGRKSSG